jgi:hypothetical protein
MYTPKDYLGEIISVIFAGIGLFFLLAVPAIAYRIFITGVR